MEKTTKDVEESLRKVQLFVFNIRRFFCKRPEIAEKYKKFLEEEKDLIG